MRVILNLTIILVLFSMLSCGKKSRLDRLPDSNYPREYSSPNDWFIKIQQ